MYQHESDGVKVSLWVGFYKAIPTEDEMDDEKEVRRSSENAGWTVVCNDRVVLYCDKTVLTGWGDANVPAFHSQFNAISGIVCFEADDASKLPITTTKRGIDMSSVLYLGTKNFMREGMKLFTGYTNRWKKDLEKEKEITHRAQLVGLQKLKNRIAPAQWTSPRGTPGSKRYTPELPSPRKQTNEKTIRFVRPLKAIQMVSRHLFGDLREPSEVGAAAFDFVKRKAEP